MYRILWHDGEGENLSPARYPTISEAIAAAEKVRSCYCSCRVPPGYDVVFADNKRVVPNWFRQMELERVN